MTAIEPQTCITAIEPQTCIIATDVVNCISTIENVSCIVPTVTIVSPAELTNFHMQKWCQSEIFLAATKKLNK